MIIAMIIQEASYRDVRREWMGEKLGGRTDWAGRQMESGCGGRGRSLGCSSGECGFVISLIEIRNKWEGAGVQGSRKMSLIWDFRGR